MNRRPAASFRVPAAVVLLALAQLSCSGGNKAPAEPPVEVTQPVKAPEPEPTPSTPSTSPEIAKASAETAVAPPSAAAEAPETATVTPPTDKETETKPEPKGEDPLKQLQESEAKKADYQRKLAEASAKVTEADAKVAEWEKNLLAYRNPYRARPQLTTKDSEEVAGKGGADRVQWAEDKLAAARVERDAAQNALNDLKASPPY